MTRGKGARGVNGHAPPPSNGVKPGKLMEVTLPDSGVTLRYRRLNSILAMQIARDFPEPEPPMVEVDLGDGKKRLESNPASPAYLKQLEEHQKELNWLGITTAIEEGVVCEVPQAEVQAYRERYRARTKSPSRPDGLELSGSDKIVYVMHICVESDDDLAALMEAIGRATHPTEAAIGEATATFPAEVPGA